MQNIEQLIVDENIPLIDAMHQLDKAGRRILFIAPGGVLKAVLTDSDVRRYILRGGDLAGPVQGAANYKPKALSQNQAGAAREFMSKNIIDAVPIVDDAGHIVQVLFANELEGMETAPEPLDVPVVIMAGGLGTRLYPYTKILPKPLIPVGEVPIVERVIQNFSRVGCNRFHLVVNYRKNMIKSYFAEQETPYAINWVEEEKPLGTGGGLGLLKGQVDGSFFLTNCDVLIEADYASILRHHQKEGNAVTMVCATKQFVIPYGVIELSEEGGYAGMSEKPCMNYLTNTGMYVVEAGVLNDIEDGVAQGFPDIIEAQRKKGNRVGVYPIAESAWMDMGQMEELDAMRRRLEQGST